MSWRSLWDYSIRQPAGRIFAGRRTRAGKARTDRDGGRDGAGRTPLMAKLSGMGKSRLDRTSQTRIAKIIPSAITLLALCAGLTSIRFAFAGNWHGALAAIVCADRKSTRLNSSHMSI